MNDAIRMQISAFVDGELPENEAELLLRRMSQDVELRRKAAEYLAIGRVMRGEINVPGIERLQERVAAAIGDRPAGESRPETQPAKQRAIRPLAGIAVAASVALAAIVGLQFVPGADRTADQPAAEAVVESNAESGYTVPRPIDEQLRQYYLSHGESSSEFGASAMNARLVTLLLSEEALSDAEETAEPVDEDGAVDDDDVTRDGE